MNELAFRQKKECQGTCRAKEQTCDDSNAFKPVPRRPRFEADLAGHFGEVLVIDLFYLWGMRFILMLN